MRLTSDSPSFTPVHSQIRAIGPRILHLAKGRGQQETYFVRGQNCSSGRAQLKWGTYSHGKPSEAVDLKTYVHSLN